MPPTTQRRSNEGVEESASAWYPREVYTPVPIMLATTRPVTMIWLRRRESHAAFEGMVLLVERFARVDLGDFVVYCFDYEVSKSTRKVGRVISPKISDFLKLGRRPSLGRVSLSAD